MGELPPTDTKRWVVRRKAAVVNAVHKGKITLEEVLRRYQLSGEEFRSWQRAFETYGLRGLRATIVRRHRGPRSRSGPRRRHWPRLPQSRKFATSASIRTLLAATTIKAAAPFYLGEIPGLPPKSDIDALLSIAAADDRRPEHGGMAQAPDLIGELVHASWPPRTGCFTMNASID
jgi:hypothetical protein